MSGLRLELLGNMPDIGKDVNAVFDDVLPSADYRRPETTNNDLQPQIKTDMSVLTSVGDWLNKNSKTITNVSTKINAGINVANQLFNQPSAQSGGGGGYNAPVLQQQPQTQTAPPPQAEKDNTMTYVAIAAGGLLFTGLVIAVIKKKKKKRAGLGHVSKSKKLKVKRIAKSRKPVSRKRKASKKKSRKRSYR